MQNAKRQLLMIGRESIHSHTIKKNTIRKKTDGRQKLVNICNICHLMLIRHQPEQSLVRSHVKHFILHSGYGQE